MLEKLEVLADSYDGYRFATVKDLAIGSSGDLFVSSPFQVRFIEFGLTTA